MLLVVFFSVGTKTKVCLKMARTRSLNLDLVAREQGNNPETLHVLTLKPTYFDTIGWQVARKDAWWETASCNLLQVKIVHVFFIKCTNPSRHKYKCFVTPRYHLLPWISLTQNHVSFVQPLYYSFSQVSRTANKMENILRMGTILFLKVSEENCWNWRSPNKAWHVTN